MSLLHRLPSLTTKSKKRVGRGIGSGVGGHTSTRGQKGQKSRRGVTIPLWFEGGNLPLVKRLPMQRGKGKFKQVRPSVEITLTDLERMPVTEITMDSLRLHKLVPTAVKKVKIIATGSVSKAVTVVGINMSAQARKLIESAGGSVRPE